jgi:intracellular multiplication protein IcmK
VESIVINKLKYYLPLLITLWLSLVFSQLTFALPPWAAGPATEGGPATSNSELAIDPILEQRLREREREKREQAAQTEAQAENTSASAANEADNMKSVQQDVRDQAFSGVVDSALPMTPEQIVQLRALFESTQRAASTIPGIPPKPVTRAAVLSLSPGITPPVVRVYSGYVSTIVFVDATGAAWNIQSYNIGNPEAFNIQWNKKDNMLMVQALTLSTVGNLMVKLQEMDTPIMLTIVPDQKEVDYRVDLRVPKFGPNAKPTRKGLPPTEDSMMLSLLNGVAPLGSKLLEVSDKETQAWQIEKKLYIRTLHNLISPGWAATVSSSDGTKVYELALTPYVLLTANGKTLPVKINGFD